MLAQQILITLPKSWVESYFTSYEKLMLHLIIQWQLKKGWFSSVWDRQLAGGLCPNQGVWSIPLWHRKGPISVTGFQHILSVKWREQKNKKGWTMSEKHSSTDVSYCLRQVKSIISKIVQFCIDCFSFILFPSSAKIKVWWIACRNGAPLFRLGRGKT